MSWERDPLWAKAKLFFERAINTNRDDPAFCLWCSLGLELLARAAVASVSPTLLALPDNEHRHLLYVLNKNSERTPPKSISTLLVFNLCIKLFPTLFTKEDFEVACALINRRNEELHSGVAAFDEYRPNQWLLGFYRTCNSLCSALDETLESLFGESEACIAHDVLAGYKEDLTHKVMQSIADHKRTFERMIDEEQKVARETSQQISLQLSTQHHHRVICPSCNSTATVQGMLFGKENVTFENDNEIIVKQSVYPTNFACSACGLKFTSYAELEVAKLNDHYTRTTSYSPAEYYGLIDPDDLDSYLTEQYSDYLEYDNE